MLKQALVTVLIIAASAMPVAADQAGDYAMLQIISKWTVWNPDELPAKLTAVNNALANGASAKAVDDNGLSALHYAAAMGVPELAEIMIAKGADPNLRDKKGRTPLRIAAGYTGFGGRQAEVARLLLGVGADITATDNDGGAPLILAAGNPDTRVMTTLLKACPPMDPRAPMAGALLLEAARTHNPGVLAILFSAGASLDAKDEEGRTVLMRALAFDGLAVRQLTAASPPGPWKDRRGPKGWTALMMAARTRDLSTVEALLATGPKLKLEDRRCLTALDHANASQHADRDKIIALLEEKGAPHGIGRWFNTMLGTAMVLLLIAGGLLRAGLKRKPA